MLGLKVAPETEAGLRKRVDQAHLMREPNAQDQRDLRPTEAGNGWSGMKAIAIAREYGSGGGEIARRLAARLGWQLLDHSIVAQAAKLMGLTEHEAESFDEHGDNFWAR